MREYKITTLISLTQIHNTLFIIGTKEEGEEE